MNKINSFEIKISLSKRKTIFLFFLCLACVSDSGWLVFYSGIDRLDAYFWGGLAFFFSFLAALYCLYKLFDQKPGLIINNQGITDNSSAANAGLVRWANIESLQITEISGRKCLTIIVNNPEEIMLNQPGWKRKMMDLNYKKFGSPVQISASMLACSFDELVQIIQEKLEERRR